MNIIIILLLQLLLTLFLFICCQRKLVIQVIALIYIQSCRSRRLVRAHWLGYQFLAESTMITGWLRSRPSPSLYS